MNSIDATTPISTDARHREAMLRSVIDEAIGTTFFEPLLKTAHNSVLKGKYGHGGRGEEVFQGQLDVELSRCMGRGIKTDLGEALYRKLARQVQA